MEKYILTILLTFLFSWSTFAQSILGSLSHMANQEIKLEGFAGLKSYSISSTKIDEKGNFSLNYSKEDYGVGYLISADKKPLFVILSGEDIELSGEALSNVRSLNITKGRENLWFEQYAKELPRREQALSAWTYLEKIYQQDSLFSVQKETKNDIIAEIKRIKRSDSDFLASLPKDSYVSWYLPARKLVSSVSVVAQYRPEELPSAIAAFRSMDYTDSRLYKSGIFKDAIESHFWLLENSGKSLDSVFIEMQISIDAMLDYLFRDEKKLNEVSDYLFALLEKHSLFPASEYLAIKVLNEGNCTINSDLARQFESYRAMKKGNTAPEISFSGMSYLNGVKQTQFSNLSSLNTPYTLVIFGAGWCPGCMEELPRAIQNYKKWRDLGLEVVYISLDTDQAAFEQAVKAYPFLTYCDFNKWDSPVVKDYFVFGTPSYILLDSMRKILLRPKSINHVDAWIDKVSVQGNK